MNTSTKALVTFAAVYFAGVIARAIVARGREQRPILESLKDLQNHATAALVAMVAAASTGFMN